MGSSAHLSSFVPIIIYSNAETDKSTILTSNKGKTGIYMWTHIETGRIYIGSAFDLSIRLSRYFSHSELKRVNNYISRAIIHHTHFAFSLSILEFIDISNLSKEEGRKLILEREQFYLDLIFKEAEPNTYNILKVAGSSLGLIHSVESKALMSEAKSGENHPRGMLGKTHSVETSALISEALSGDKNPRGMLGKSLSADTKALMSKAKSGDKNPRGMLGKSFSAETKALMSKAKIGENHPNFGKFLSAETKTKISASQGTTIFVYDSQGSLVNSFTSARKAALHFDVSKNTILKYAQNGQIFKEQWILSISLREKK